ncbi:TPA: hypothetical protein ACIBOF_001733, partial [Salmonella enterica subsp. diarizonae serovar 61:r:-]
MIYRFAILIVIVILGIISIATAYAIGAPTSIFFYIFYIVLFIFYPPKYVISPLTILYVYYGLWFLLAPLFAQRYVGINNELSYSYSFIL